MEPSSYKEIDNLNYQGALFGGGKSVVRPQTKFESVVNSINSFLQTASNTVVTIDDVINTPRETSAHSDGVTNNGSNPAGTPQQPGSFLKYVVAGSVAVGSVVAYRTLTK